MGKQALKYGATLIGIYLGVAYASGAGTLITSLANGGATVTKSLQGR
jgi:hypothetical protein